MAPEKSKINREGVDYGELVDFIAEKFDRNKKEIIGEINEMLKTKADKSDIVNKADKSDLTNKADKSDVNAIMSRINVIGNKIDDYRADYSKTAKKVEIHEKWIATAAPKIGVKIEK